MLHSAEKSLKVVAHFDPGLDMTEAELRKYAGPEGTRDPALVRALPGAKLTWYVIRPMTKAIMRMIDVSHSRTEVAFAYGVSAVLDAVDDDGHVTPKIEPTGKQLIAGTEVPVWRSEDLERVDFWAVEEIGGVAYAHSSFRHGIVRVYPLLLSSPLVKGAVERRLAEKTLRDATLNSSSHMEAQAVVALAQKLHALSGEEPTAAIATG